VVSSIKKYEILALDKNGFAGAHLCVGLKVADTWVLPYMTILTVTKFFNIMLVFEITLSQMLY